MSMTRKDFQAIASKVIEARDEYANLAREAYIDGDHVTRRSYESVIVGIDIAATRISEALAASNPRFDRLNFLEAAGVR